MTTQTDHPTALVLGLTGAIGGAVAAALHLRGWAIRALTRRAVAKRPAFAHPVDWREGDALDADAVRHAAEGADIIFHGVNPPGYAHWREDGLPMLANTIAAARASGAQASTTTVLFPANVYVFSPASPALVDETAPRRPTTRKGQVRLEMETMLEAAQRDHGVRVIALRAGDFFGPGVVNSWFAQGMAKRGMDAKVLRRLAALGAAHAWAYVPDLAEAFAQLAERRAALPAFTLAHFAGHADMTGLEMAQAAQRALGREVPIRPFPWWTMWAGAPFVGFLREALEMRWLWTTSLALDNRKLVSLIGSEPHTPLDEAVARTLGAAP
jgi:nucleoside-diphosphate-sugar epimerase